MKKFFADFKAFITKGNIIDMAVGVIIGGAFGKIVTSLVNDIITPLISILTGKVSLTELKWVINEAVLDEAGAVVTPELALTYGNFLQNIIDFLIIIVVIGAVVGIALRMGVVERVTNQSNLEEARISFLIQDIQESSADYFKTGDIFYAESFDCEFG